MVLPLEDIFDYTFDVVDPLRAGQKLAGRPREDLPKDDLRRVRHGDRRLVGHAPSLEASEYQRQPWQLYARITLIASDPSNATVKSVSFSVERGLVRVLRLGDVLHISRTGCAGIGLSILRDDQLVAAAGAISYVPLGVDVSVRFPDDLTDQVEAIYRTRDPEYEMREYPIELSIEGATRILHGGRPRIGPYEVLVRHGFFPGIPGTNECVSIERCGVCPDTAAHTSAQLLEEEGLQIDDRN